MKNISLKEWSSISTAILTALAVLYTTIAKIWGLPFVEEIPNTIYALSAFIATVLGITTVGKVSTRQKAKQKV